MRARSYDPAVGRFLTQDTHLVDYSNPLELNRYVYVANNPVNAIDPSGHSNVMTWGLTAQATTGGGGNGPRGRLGAVMGGLAGAAVSGILAHSRYSLMQAGLYGPRLEQFTKEVGFPVFMATGALAGGVIGHAAGGGLPTQLLSQISFALAVMSLTPTAIDIIFQGNSQAFCNMLDVIVGIGGVLLGASGSSPPTTAGEVVVTENTLAIVGEQINSVLAGASAALMMSSGNPGGGGGGGNDNEIWSYTDPETGKEYKVGPHGQMPSPRGDNESHHGVMSRWMQQLFGTRYRPDKAPAVLMPEADHHLTRGYYNTWRANMRTQMGGTFDWGRITRSQIIDLANGMFDAADVPQPVRDQYWTRWNNFMRGLENP